MAPAHAKERNLVQHTTPYQHSRRRRRLRNGCGSDRRPRRPLGAQAPRVRQARLAPPAPGSATHVQVRAGRRPHAAPAPLRRRRDHRPRTSLVATARPEWRPDGPAALPLAASGCVPCRPWPRRCVRGRCRGVCGRFPRRVRGGGRTPGCSGNPGRGGSASGEPVRRRSAIPGRSPSGSSPSPRSPLAVPRCIRRTPASTTCAAARTPGSCYGAGTRSGRPRTA